jgi:formylglycine-generating enzyme required for sulfatase activity
MFESLTSQQRILLIQHVNALMQADFEALVFAIGAPPNVIPSESAAQGNRSSALLNWVRSPTGCGGEEFIEVLNAIAPLPFDVNVESPVPPPRPREPITQTPQPQQIPQPQAPEPASKPKQHKLVLSNAPFQEKLPNGILLDMVYVPDGEFLMGSPLNEADRHESESPQHKVKIPSFFMGKYPVTQAHWNAVSLLDKVNQPLKPNPSRFKGDSRPVECVSWNDAIEFCERLSIYTGRDYRLPSEAEWEYACRAKTTTNFYVGAKLLPRYANYKTISRVALETGKRTFVFPITPVLWGIDTVVGHVGQRKHETTNVGEYRCNSFGLYDMHGNVWEWCQDFWHENYDGAPTDGSPWVEGGELNERVLRGGSFNSLQNFCRSACRFGKAPEFVSPLDLFSSSMIFADITGSTTIGFRVCCSAHKNT